MSRSHHQPSSGVRTGVLAALAGQTDHRSARDRRILEGFTGVLATDGNHVTALRNGDEIFPAMLDTI